MRLIIAATAIAAAAAAQPALAQNGAGGNGARGAQIYDDKCTGCHSLDANRIGPAHRGVFGRKAGLAKGFVYSPAVKASRVIWSEPTLDRWLTSPGAFIKGSRMGFTLSNPQQRADVIAFLKRESGKK